MATEAQKPTNAPTEHPPFQIYPPPPPGQHPYPPGPFPPPLFFPPPPDGSDPNAAAAFMMPYPPNMMYAYPPPPGQPYPYPPSPPATSESRQKRKQVKMACTNCAAACKRCDDTRPCERCEKYGISDSCVDGQRKERKKGVKRGPYKRKNKSITYVAQDPAWSTFNSDAPNPPPPSNAAAVQALAQYATVTQDGQLQYAYYPPPNAPFFALGVPDPSANGANPQQPVGAGEHQQPTMVPLMFHPGAYQFVPHPYATPGYMPPMAPMAMPQQPQTSHAQPPATAHPQVASTSSATGSTSAPSEGRSKSSPPVQEREAAKSSKPASPAITPSPNAESALQSPASNPDKQREQHADDDDDDNDMEPVILSGS